MSELMHIAWNNDEGESFEVARDGSITRPMARDNRVYLDSRMACRHGLVCGATGTGKTITLKVLTEAFNRIGTPVIITDIKGDISGLAAPGVMTEKLAARAKRFGVDDYQVEALSGVRFYDPFVKHKPAGSLIWPGGMPFYELNTDLLARLLGLTQAQSGILDIVYRVCEDNRVRLDSLADLRWMINYVQMNKDKLGKRYGYVPVSSAGVVLRSILKLENEGANEIFGPCSGEEWSLIPNDQPLPSRRVSILDCTELAHKPLLYSAYLLWLLDKLNSVYPEVGDCEKPRLVLIFDEAHLIFNGAEKVLLEKVEQTVKLIRSKGIGVYFCTQAPTDIPDGVLSQLGNRIEHALRAYTPNEQKKVKAAAASFRPNPSFRTIDVIGELGVGEALVSFLNEQGIPQMVKRCNIIAPRCAMGAYERG